MTKLTKESVRELKKELKSFGFGGRLKIKQMASPATVEKLKIILKNLKREKRAPKDAHLISGVQDFELKIVEDDPLLSIKEVPVLYPNKRAYGEYDIYFGPMTGVIVHCYDEKNGVYAMHMRGQDVPFPGKIQCSAAGFGKYGEPPEQTAVRELEEELGKKGTLVELLEGDFLDITPNTSHGYPQILFSYVIEADLSDLPLLESPKEIIKLTEKPKRGEVAHKFSVPLNRLGWISKRLNRNNKFFGPMRMTKDSFLDWRLMLEVIE